MISDKWTVNIIRQATYYRNNLPPKVLDKFVLLMTQLKTLGPIRHNWLNYTKIKDEYHCHIHRGRPTYVVCWRVLDKKDKKMEIYYAGTHEKAPY